MSKVMALCLLVAAASFAHIQPGSLSLKSGTTLKTGQKVSLSWSASIDHNKSAYTVWYSPDAGKTWTTVKSGIPGQASGVAVVYEWTVPTTPTTTGMIRVFQAFGGTVSSNPSNPGDYTLFSPVFKIEAPTSVARLASSGAGRSVIHFGGDDLEIRFGGLRSGNATLDVLELDGSLRRTLVLGHVDANSSSARVISADLGRAGTKIVCLRVDGVAVDRKLIASTH